MGRVKSSIRSVHTRGGLPLTLVGWLIAGLCSPVGSTTNCSAQSERSVSVGIAGHYRVGHWTAVRVDADQRDAGRLLQGAAVIETRDGDGVQVIYEQSGSLLGGEFGYAIPGSEAAPLLIRAAGGEDSVGEVMISTRFPVLGSPARGASMVPSQMPWIVATGDPLGVDSIGANELLNRDALLAVSQPARAADYPDSVLGYSGVDMILIGSSSRDTLESLSAEQRQAISEWILGGGRVFLTLGRQGPDLIESSPWLRDLLPFESGPLRKETLDPSAIETYTASQVPLRPFEGVRLPRGSGRVLILGRTVRRESTPFAIEYPVGFGSITVFAADLEDPLFAQWPERLDLITRLTGSALVPRQSNQGGVSRATAYDDLAGQLRLTLDQFNVKRTVGFSIVSLILMGLIAAIGPLDYLLINRVFGRPLLGWVSVPVIAIGLSLVLFFQSQPLAARPAAGSASPIDPLGETGAHRLASTEVEQDPTLRCNRLEIVDLDPSRGLGRGFSVGFLYSHPARKVDVAVTAESDLQAITARTERVLTAPFGYPGESFGGIQIAIEDSRLPTYRVRTDDSEQDFLRSSISSAPLAPRSSKAFATQLWFEPDLPVGQPLTRRPGSLLLQGSMANPLPIDLLEGMLIYRNWVYLLPTRFPARARIGSLEELRQKNFRWQLSRQKSLEENVTETEAWDPASRDSLDRVAEMLMFHEAVGGSRYTSLKHDPLSFLDLTETLTEDRCMLVAKVANPLTRLSVTDSNGAEQQPAGQSLSLIRVLLPVVTAE